jgi:hypothetical protein
MCDAQYPSHWPAYNVDMPSVVTEGDPLYMYPNTAFGSASGLPVQQPYVRPTYYY